MKKRILLIRENILSKVILNKSIIYFTVKIKKQYPKMLQKIKNTWKRLRKSIVSNTKNDIYLNLKNFKRKRNDIIRRASS